MDQELRLNKQRERAAPRRQLAPAEKEERMILARIRTARRRQMETPEETQERLHRDRIRAAARRRNPTITVADQKRRLIKKRERTADIRRQETPSQREERLAMNRIRTAQRRQWETPQERQERLYKDRIRAAARRRKMTIDEAKLEELERLRECHKRLGHRQAEIEFVELQRTGEPEIDRRETAVQRKERLARDRIRKAQTRLLETPQERRERLCKNRIRAAARRWKPTRAEAKLETLEQTEIEFVELQGGFQPEINNLVPSDDCDSEILREVVVEYEPLNF